MLASLLSGCLVTFSAVLAHPAKAAAAADTYVRIAVDAGPNLFERIQTVADWLREKDFDIAGAVISERFIGVVTSRDRIVELEKRGLRILDSQPLGPLDDPQFRAFSDYFNPVEVEAFLDGVVLDHPDITRKFAIGTTWEGRTIWALEISDQPAVVENEPAVLLNGCHHSREVHTPHIVTDAIDWLTDNYLAGDPTAVSWVTKYKIICVPMVNPDGSNHVFTVSSGWRKNRRNNGGGSFGVDLNRNYPYHWGSGPANCERGSGSSGSTSSDVYRGPSPASEPETQTMIDLAAAWDFVIAVSYHSFGQFIDYPYACNDGNPDNSMPEHGVIHSMMLGVRDGIVAAGGPSYSVFSPIALGPVNGDDTSWYYANMGAYAFIIESGTSFAPAFSSLPTILSGERGGWQYLLSRLGEARLDVFVTDACSGDALEAEVELTDFVYDTDELPRFTSLPFGRRTFLVLPNQSYNVRVSKAGYVTQTTSAAVGNLPATLAVQLIPDIAVPLVGDMDESGGVDGRDVQPFIDTMLQGPAADPTLIARGDFVRDCILDAQDLAMLTDALLAD